MTMSGKNFLNSARDSFYLIKRNEQKYEMIEGLGYLFFLIIYITHVPTFIF